MLFFFSMRSSIHSVQGVLYKLAPITLHCIFMGQRSHLLIMFFTVFPTFSWMKKNLLLLCSTVVDGEGLVATAAQFRSMEFPVLCVLQLWMEKTKMREMAMQLNSNINPSGHQDASQLLCSSCSPSFCIHIYSKIVLHHKIFHGFWEFWSEDWPWTW